MLVQALTSVAAQTHLPDEVVVVDDAGDDDVARTVKELSEELRLPVTYTVNLEGQGAASSRNLGARAAKGEVLAFLDDDDRWRPRYLETALECLQCGGEPVVLTWIRIRGGKRHGAGVEIGVGLDAARALSRNPGITGSNLLLLRSAFERVGGFDESLWVGEDRELLVRLLDAGLRYGVVREHLVEKVSHAGPRLTTVGDGRVTAMRRYVDKYESRLTAADRRFLQFQFHRQLRRSAPTARERWSSAAALIPLLGAAEVSEIVRYWGPLAPLRALERLLKQQGGGS